MRWEMWAGVDSDHKFAEGEDPTEVVYEYPASNRRYPQAHGCEEIVRVTLIENEEGPYWGWLNNPTDFTPDPTPSMVFRRKTLFQVCFPYGVEAEAKRGDGRVLRLRIEPSSESA